jgi:hypothetical protein
MTGTCIGVLDGTLTYSFLNLRSWGWNLKSYF